MTREEFKERYESHWERLEHMIVMIREQNLTASLHWTDSHDFAEFDRLYRQVCKHLALARTRQYGTDIVDRLNDLTQRAHDQFYRSPRGFLIRSWRYIAGGFAQDIRRESIFVWIAIAVFVIPGLGAATARILHEDAAAVILGPATVHEMETMYSEESGYRPADRAGDTDTMMFGFYVYNNIGIAFKAFAIGILFCVGSAYILVTNGLVMGAVFAHLTLIGSGERLWSFVITHGSLELTAIVLSGAIGFKLGWAVIAPGRRRRSQSIYDAAQESVGPLVGIFFMLLGAAFIEAYWSSSDLPAQVKYLVGGVCWTLVVVYFIWAGRSGARSL